MDTNVCRIIQIDARTWRIEEPEVRCFLFAGDERALLLDSGFHISDILGVVRTVTALPVMLANTHSDYDHIACNGQFEAAYMSPAEFCCYSKQKSQTTPCRPLWDGDVIDLGGRRLEVIGIPGHTPGSIALLDREARILAGGDSVQDGRIYLFGENRDLSAYLCSLEKLQRRAGEFDWVYPCHGSFPVPASILPQLISGTREVLAGRIKGVPALEGELPILTYDIGAATLLYDYDILFS